MKPYIKASIAAITMCASTYSFSYTCGCPALKYNYTPITSVSSPTPYNASSCKTALIAANYPNNVIFNNNGINCGGTNGSVTCLDGCLYWN